MSRQLIVCQLGEQFVGLNTMAIREIRAWTQTTLLPKAPPHVRGVVNLRGIVLPVIDLSARLGWGLTEPSGRHVIVVVEIGEQLQGFIVDGVSDIVTIGDDAMQPPPSIGTAGLAQFLEGVATVEHSMVMVLKLDMLACEAPVLVEAA
jgi:purine-binding chemotaxis protein CheW